jgi:hypothetical protein
VTRSLPGVRSLRSSSTPLGSALRRAYGAALYVDRDHPGVADHVTEAIESAGDDEPWTAMRWMVVSALVRRACQGLPVGVSDSYADEALRMLRIQLAIALQEGYATIEMGAERA